jgi:hypothetical protein
MSNTLLPVLDIYLSRGEYLPGSHSRAARGRREETRQAWISHRKRRDVR